MADVLAAGGAVVSDGVSPTCACPCSARCRSSSERAPSTWPAPNDVGCWRCSRAGLGEWSRSRHSSTRCGGRTRRPRQPRRSSRTWSGCASHWPRPGTRSRPVRVATGSASSRTPSTSPASRGWRRRVRPSSAPGLRDGHAVVQEAEALWRGPALMEFGDDDFAVGDRTLLEERRLVVHEDLAEARFAYERCVGGRRRHGADGRGVAGARTFVGLVDESAVRGGTPSRRHSPRSSGRTVMGEEFGLEPGPELRELERRIIDEDPGLTTVHRRHLPSSLRRTRRWSDGTTSSTGCARRGSRQRRASGRCARYWAPTALGARG